MLMKIFRTRMQSECCCIESTIRCTLISLCLVMLFSVPSTADLRDGLINYWPLDGDATDSVGKHDGEVIGGPHG